MGHVQRLLTCHADPNLTNAYGRTPLHSAAARPSGRVDPTMIIRYLHAARADPNIGTCDGTTPLHVACGIGNAAVVATLASIGADIHAFDAQNRSPLWFSIFRKSLPCCNSLLEFLADPCRLVYKGNVSALAYAIDTRQHEVVEVLQAHVCDNLELLVRAAKHDLGESFREE